MALHLFKEENQQIRTLETLDGHFSDEQRQEARKAVENSLVDMQLETALTQGKCGIFSVAISPREDEALTPEQYERAISIIEEEFGFTGQNRVRVDHLKEGRFHSHLMWSLTRYDEEKEKHLLIPVGRYKRRLQSKADEMVAEFGLREVNRLPNENTIEITNADRMREARAKKEAKENGEAYQKIQDKKREIAELWNASKDGQAFLDNLRVKGYTVAKGDKESKRVKGNGIASYVLVDAQGNVSNLTRELPKLVKVKHVRERFAGMEDKILSVEAAQKYLAVNREEAEIERTNKELDAADLTGRNQEEEKRQSGLKEKDNDKKGRVAGHEERSGKVAENRSNKVEESKNKATSRAGGNISGVEKLRANFKEKVPDKRKSSLPQVKDWGVIIDEERKAKGALNLFERQFNQKEELDRKEAELARLKEELKQKDNKRDREKGLYDEALERLKAHTANLEGIKAYIQQKKEQFKEELGKQQQKNPRVEKEEPVEEKPVAPVKEHESNVVKFKDAAEEKKAKEETFKERMRRSRAQKNRDRGKDLDFER
jgi:hypothetical protein